MTSSRKHSSKRFARAAAHRTPNAPCGRSSVRLTVARLDPELLRHLLVAAVCLVAYEEGRSPRAVLDELFRRSVSDGEWRERYEPLLA